MKRYEISRNLYSTIMVIVECENGRYVRHKEAMDLIKPLRSFAKMFVQCPCCGEKEVCADDCTYKEDCLDMTYYNYMVMARAAIAGKEA